MKTLSNAELQDAIGHTTRLIKGDNSHHDNILIVHLENLTDEQRYRATDELTLEPMTTTLERAEFDARVAAYELFKPRKWIEWQGVACPLFEDSIIDVQLRDGRQWDVVRAGDLDWAPSKHHSNRDIVRYRNSAPAPREQSK